MVFSCASVIDECFNIPGNKGGCAYALYSDISASVLEPTTRPHRMSTSNVS